MRFMVIQNSIATNAVICDDDEEFVEGLTVVASDTASIGDIFVDGMFFSAPLPLPSFRSVLIADIDRTIAEITGRAATVCEDHNSPEALADGLRTAVDLLGVQSMRENEVSQAASDAEAIAAYSHIKLMVAAIGAQIARSDSAAPDAVRSVQQ